VLLSSSVLQEVMTGTRSWTAWSVMTRRRTRGQRWPAWCRAAVAWAWPLPWSPAKRTLPSVWSMRGRRSLAVVRVLVWGVQGQEGTLDRTITPDTVPSARGLESYALHHPWLSPLQSSMEKRPALNRRQKHGSSEKHKIAEALPSHVGFTQLQSYVTSCLMINCI
jgi:hypothetical protein